MQTLIFWWRRRNVNDDVFITYEEDYQPKTGESTQIDEDNTETKA
jgi:proton-dependent oligopeptide transporter, POT family